MATADQRRALLAVSCPWCGASPGDYCTARADSGRRGRGALRITSLDGGCHDARWKLAVGREAKVIAEVVAEIVGFDHQGNPRVRRASQIAAPAGDVAVMERPW